MFFFLQLYTNCRLVERVINAWEENANDETRPGFHRKGYMGHLTKIANIMVSFSDNLSFISLMVADLLSQSHFLNIFSMKISRTKPSVNI